MLKTARIQFQSSSLHPPLFLRSSSYDPIVPEGRKSGLEANLKRRWNESIAKADWEGWRSHEKKIQRVFKEGGALLMFLGCFWLIVSNLQQVYLPLKHTFLIRGRYTTRYSLIFKTLDSKMPKSAPPYAKLSRKILFLNFRTFRDEN